MKDEVTVLNNFSAAKLRPSHKGIESSLQFFFLSIMLDLTLFFIFKNTPIIFHAEYLFHVACKLLTLQILSRLVIILFSNISTAY